jgi:prepilin-type processing-associated H-X9-DG protein
MGSNVLFADGHGKWYHVRYLVAKGYCDGITGEVVIRDHEVRGRKGMWNVDNQD